LAKRQLDDGQDDGLDDSENGSWDDGVPDYENEDNTVDASEVADDYAASGGDSGDSSVPPEDDMASQDNSGDNSIPPEDDMASQDDSIPPEDYSSGQMAPDGQDTSIGDAFEQEAPEEESDGANNN